MLRARSIFQLGRRLPASRLRAAMPRTAQKRVIQSSSRSRYGVFATLSYPFTQRTDSSTSVLLEACIRDPLQCAPPLRLPEYSLPSSGRFTTPTTTSLSTSSRNQIRPQRVASHVIASPVDRIDNPAPPATRFRACSFFAQDAVVGKSFAQTCVRSFVRTRDRLGLQGICSGLVSATMFGWYCNASSAAFLRGSHRRFEFLRPQSTP